MAALIPTQDPNVAIEEKRDGYVRYVNRQGRRWEVWGTCDGRGHCWVGARRTDGTLIKTLEEAQQYIAQFRANGDGLDCPVTPGFNDCCPFTFVDLPAR